MVFVPGLMSSGVAFSSIHSGTSISRKAKGQEEFVHHNKVSLYRHCIPYILLIAELHARAKPARGRSPIAK